MDDAAKLEVLRGLSEQLRRRERAFGGAVSGVEADCLDAAISALAARSSPCARCDGTREIRYKDPRGYTVVDECKMCAPDDREWFWRIVDAAEIADLPSIEEDALRILCERASRAKRLSDELSAAQRAKLDDRLKGRPTPVIEVDDLGSPACDELA